MSLGRPLPQPFPGLHSTSYVPGTTGGRGVPLTPLPPPRASERSFPAFAELARASHIRKQQNQSRRNIGAFLRSLWENSRKDGGASGWSQLRAGPEPVRGRSVRKLYYKYYFFNLFVFFPSVTRGLIELETHRSGAKWDFCQPLRVVNQVRWLGESCFEGPARAKSDPVLMGELDSDFSVTVLDMIGHYF